MKRHRWVNVLPFTYHFAEGLILRYFKVFGVVSSLWSEKAPATRVALSSRAVWIKSVNWSRIAGCLSFSGHDHYLLALCQQHEEQVFSSVVCFFCMQCNISAPCLASVVVFIRGCSGTGEYEAGKGKKAQYTHKKTRLHHWITFFSSAWKKCHACAVSSDLKLDVSERNGSLFSVLVIQQPLQPVLDWRTRTALVVRYTARCTHAARVHPQFSLHSSSLCILFKKINYSRILVYFETEGVSGTLKKWIK